MPIRTLVGGELRPYQLDGIMFMLSLYNNDVNGKIQVQLTSATHVEAAASFLSVIPSRLQWRDGRIGIVVAPTGTILHCTCAVLPSPVTVIPSTVVRLSAATTSKLLTSCAGLAVQFTATFQRHASEAHVRSALQQLTSMAHFVRSLQQYT